jgi:WD40 repeat protein
LSADSGVVLIGGGAAVNGANGARFYDISDFDKVRVLNETPTAAMPYECLALSHQGRRLNFTGDGLSGQWLINTGEDGRVAQFEKDYGRRWVSCAYSPDATKIALISHTRQGLKSVLTLAAVSDDRVTKIRDIPLAEKAGAAALRFSQSGDNVAVAVAITETATAIRIFDAHTGAAIREFTTPNAVSDLALSRDGVLVTVENAYTYGLFLRSIEGDTTATMLPNSGSDDDYGGLAFSPDGGRLAAVNGDTAKLWEVATLARSKDIPARSWPSDSTRRTSS